ncbi:uncharacterized protein LOC114658023 [Erpetoichthys calabaricus]|uniref:uncharacterized protein LOC114658023 n=1 Tax=Erpetoichthys calabaricus TaxID=27687 RepID=UPI00109F1965|nr:uncharacterized protein LOC114658023 [Erpetoichthys calabaricus]
MYYLATLSLLVIKVAFPESDVVLPEFKDNSLSLILMVNKLEPREGESVEFKCAILAAFSQSHQKMTTTFWLSKDGIVLQSKTEHRGATPVFAIEFIQKADSGFYTCIYNTSNDNKGERRVESERVKLTVKDSEYSISLNLDTPIAPLLAKVEFKCMLRNYKQELEKQKNLNFYLFQNTIAVDSRPFSSSLPAVSFPLLNLSLSHTGSYICGLGVNKSFLTILKRSAAVQLLVNVSQVSPSPASPEDTNEKYDSPQKLVIFLAAGAGAAIVLLILLSLALLRHFHPKKGSKMNAEHVYESMVDIRQETPSFES